ncbi:MAG: hypothetical protein DSM106950_31945 [Stigonema ocellatum SAG 48.90 = DSM 106950]|nr:hypothetical protein [Stigonema ocellatum SAG 48.90 = DSM 106950]
MHHFNFKSLAFYGVAIGSVLLLFKVVTAYGESNLKAPPAINGRYRLEFSERLPICEKSEALILDIQQSGIYVNGFLLPVTANAKNSTDTATHPTLTGKLTNQELILSGKVPKTTICNMTSSQTQANTRTQDNSFNFVKMQIQLVSKAGFSGEIHLSNTNNGIAFTATPQKAQKSEL